MIKTTPMQVLRKIALVICLAALTSTVFAAVFPKPSGFVNDFAGVLDSKTNTQLTNILREFRRASENEVVVATVPSLDNEPIENYTVGMFKEWGIGKKGKDNGALILVAPNDRQMRIEVGYGLEPYINDALAGRIVRDTMIPHFREGNFPLGILNGAVEVVSTIAKKTNLAFDPVAAGGVAPESLYHVSEEAPKPTSLLAKIFKIILVIFFILLFIKNPWAALFILSSFGGGRGGSFRGGFGGGGFSGFGGGMSGGGGSSGRW